MSGGRAGCVSVEAWGDAALRTKVGLCVCTGRQARVWVGP